MSDNAEPDAKTLGRTVARLRKLRGLSQREFASIVDRSETWLSQVERGVRRIDRMTVLQRLADALDVPVADLAPSTPVAVRQQPTEEARTLTLALTSSDALAAVLADGAAEGSDRDRDAAVAEVWRELDAGEYDRASGRLTGLVPQLEHAVRAAGGTTRTAEQLASAYEAYAEVLSALGEFAGAWVAAERAVAAAERAKDPLAMAAAELRLIGVFEADRRHQYATHAATSAIAALAERVAAGDADASVLSGALRLAAAVAGARVDDSDAAYDHLEQARALADRLGADRAARAVTFGPTSVGLTRVSVAVELGDAGAALRAASGLDTSSLPADRRAAYLIDVARAHAQRRNLTEVVTALTEAHELAPDQVVGHPIVQGLVTDLLRSGEDPSLRRLAGDLDIPT